MNMNEAAKLLHIPPLPHPLVYEGSFTLYVNELHTLSTTRPAYVIVAPLAYCYGEHQVVQVWHQKPAKWDTIAAVYEPIKKIEQWPDEVVHIVYKQSIDGKHDCNGIAPTHLTIDKFKPSKQAKSKVVRGAIDKIKQMLGKRSYVKKQDGTVWAFLLLADVLAKECFYLGTKCNTDDKAEYSTASISLAHSNTLSYSELCCLVEMVGHDSISTRPELNAPFIYCANGLIHIMASNGHAGLMIAFKYEYEEQLEGAAFVFVPEQFDELLAYMNKFKVKQVELITTHAGVKLSARADGGSYSLGAHESKASYLTRTPTTIYGLPDQRLRAFQVPNLAESAKHSGNFSLSYLDFVFNKQLSRLCNEAGYEVKAQSIRAEKSRLNGMMQAWLQNGEHTASMILMPTS